MWAWAAAEVPLGATVYTECKAVYRKVGERIFNLLPIYGSGRLLVHENHLGKAQFSPVKAYTPEEAPEGVFAVILEGCQMQPGIAKSGNKFYANVFPLASHPAALSRFNELADCRLVEMARTYLQIIRAESAAPEEIISRKIVFLR